MELDYSVEELLKTGLLALLLLVAVKFLLAYLKWRSAVNVMRNVPGYSDVIPFKDNLQILWNALKGGFKEEGNLVAFRLRVRSAERYKREGWYLNTFAFTPVVTIFRHEIAEPLLNSNTLLTKGPIYNFLKPWLGDGLLVSTGRKWHQRRKMLTPAFHFRILEDFNPIMNEQSQILVQKLRSLSKQPYVNLVPLVSYCALDIICETAMGVKINSQSDNNSEYVKAVNDFSTAAVQRVHRPYLWRDFIFKLTSIGKRYYKSLDVMHSFTKSVIEKRKEEFLQKLTNNEQEMNSELEQLTGKRRRAFLDLLLATHFSDDSFTIDDIREEVDTFMFEGHDTTAMGMSWALYLLGLHPDVQKKVQEELDAIFGDDKTRHATSDDLREMKYLECVIKEAQRLYPSVPAIARSLTEDLKIDNYTITKGSMVTIFIYMVHRDERIYPDPEAFNPDRFLSESSTGRNPFSYVPFSAGPRNCIGQKFAMNEEKVLISTVLRNFSVKSLDPREKVTTIIELVLRPRGELRIQFIPRK